MESSENLPAHVERDTHRLSFEAPIKDCWSLWQHPRHMKHVLAKIHRSHHCDQTLQLKLLKTLELTLKYLSHFNNRWGSLVMVYTPK